MAQSNNYNIAGPAASPSSTFSPAPGRRTLLPPGCNAAASARDPLCFSVMPACLSGLRMGGPSACWTGDHITTAPRCSRPGPCGIWRNLLFPRGCIPQKRAGFADRFVPQPGSGLCAAARTLTENGKNVLSVIFSCPVIGYNACSKSIW